MIPSSFPPSFERLDPPACEVSSMNMLIPARAINIESQLQAACRCDCCSGLTDEPVAAGIAKGVACLPPTPAFVNIREA